MTGPKLSPKQREAADTLALTILGGFTLAIDVRCPHCGGVRTVRPNLLLDWLAKRRVPGCAAVLRHNVGTHCRDVPAKEAA